MTEAEIYTERDATQTMYSLLKGLQEIFNPRHACVARVTVLGSVCPSVTTFSATMRNKLANGTNGSSATLASFKKW